VGRIRILSDSLVNRIAAGEVVERPASVVKELVENSLDAGARSVRVRCDAGGRRSIEVADDGAGMDRDDAVLALERHATSKLADASGLDCIRTLGFRGEALASIAAVSAFLLRTADRDGAGTEVEVRGGRIVDVRDAGLPQGTTVRVDRLFFNVPARRKFLRSEATELSHVARLVTRFALAHPEVAFELEHGGRRLVHTPVAGTTVERIAQVYGRELARKLLPFDVADAAARVRGFAGRPADALPRRDGQHLFVNGRWVQDRMLAHAVSRAYGNTMPAGRHPVLVLLVDVDPAAVDVNVHPQKTEVRFRAPSEVHDAVVRALGGALGATEVVPDLADLRPGPRPAAPGPHRDLARAVVAGLERQAFATVAARHAFTLAEPAGSRDPAPRPPAAHGDDERLPEPWAPDGVAGVPRCLAQYRDSYIVAQDERGLVLVDQHAAHERVLFERFLAEAEAGRVEVQRLLFPVTFDLSADELVTLEAEIEEFRRLGFVLEPFGGRTVRIDGIPALAAEVRPESLVRELLGEAGRTRSAVAGGQALRHRLVTTAACKAAIKIRHPLGREAMQALLDDLFRADAPSTCPHGRPLLFRLSHDEIERAFRRR